jgi:LacI family transcriptional regulator, repressor for deo operon, udp, cdd, tsx, nupC, and nupG
MLHFNVNMNVKVWRSAFLKTDSSRTNTVASSEKRPTIKDVAKQANVSAQTVSAVINGKPGITDQTRKRVRGIIEELGYRPFGIARSLRTGQTRTIALIVSDIENPFFSKVASTAEDYAHHSGYSLILYNTHDDPERENRYLEQALQNWVDGVLFVATQDRVKSLEMLKAADVPYVALDRIPEQYQGPSITLDNVLASQMATQHLIELGHRRIVHVSGPLHLRLARERLKGYTEAMESHELSPIHEVEEDSNWRFEDGYITTQRMLARESRPTAIAAANDRMAIGAMRAIVDAGLRVPDDISVIGVDDLAVAAYCIPTLTTIRQPFNEIGTLGIRLLLDILEKKPIEQISITLRPTLVIRQSTAPLP